MTVLPGFVSMQMTEGMELPSRLTARSSEVAGTMEQGCGRYRTGLKEKDTIYVRPVWRWIAAIIRNILEHIFKVLKI